MKRGYEKRGSIFTNRCFIRIFVADYIQFLSSMDTLVWDGIFFVDSLADYDFIRHSSYVLHILCTGGNMSFMFQDIRYNVTCGDYVILPTTSLASDFSESADFSAIIMGLSEPFVSSMAIRSNYGIAGHLALLQNPVMKLSPYDFRICRKDMQRLRERLERHDHLFHKEMIGNLLTAHILDLYDIHARCHKTMQIPERAASLLRHFIELLYKGEYTHSRSLSHYASMLCVTPHYLSEVCRKASGCPATYWIDRFTLHHIMRLLCQKHLALKEIADELGFSSLSYFSRYVQKHTGMSPSEYRNSIAHSFSEQ